MRVDTLVLGGVTILLLAAVVIMVLRLLDQSEKHVDTVKDIKVEYAKSEFQPTSSESDAEMIRDVEANPDMTKGDYRHYVLTKNSFKILSRMRKLEELVLADCEFEDNKWLRYLEKLPLKHLDLSGTDFNDEGAEYVSRIETLEKLIFFDTKISGKGLKMLTKLKKISRLEMDGVPIGDEDVVLLKEFPDLSNLCLSGTRITDKGCDVLQSLEKLTYLELSRTNVKRAGLLKLASLPKLHSMQMKNANLHDEDVEVLAQYPRLYSLQLHGNPITDRGLLALSKSKSLKEIYLMGCDNLTKPTLDKVRALGFTLGTGKEAAGSLGDVIKSNFLED